MSGRSSIGLGKTGVAALAAFLCLLVLPVEAQRIENSVAVFAALDKVTAAVQKLPAKLNETESFRTLRITPRVCYTRAATEPPRTSTFVEIDEIMFDGKAKRIFTGWMFAESPGLNPLLHPVFDVWLTSCGQPRGEPTAKAPPAPPSAAPPSAAPPDAAAPPTAPPADGERRRRPPR